MIRSPEYETMPREQLENLQLNRLQSTVAYVYEKVPFYHNALKAKEITPGSIKSLSDLARLPFTSKLDFRDNYPFGLTCLPAFNPYIYSPYTLNLVPLSIFEAGLKVLSKTYSSLLSDV